MNNTFLKTGFIVAMSAFTFVACQKDDDMNDDMDMDKTQLYVTNNSDGNVTLYNLDDNSMKTYTTASMMTEGVYYNGDMDKMIVASRSSNQLNVYKDIMDMEAGAITPAFSSASDLMSPRDVAVRGNMVVVADNADVDGDSNTPDGRLYIYTKNDNSLTLRNTVTTDFAVWGIEFIDDELYAIVDKTNMLAVFNDFLDANMTDALALPSKKIMVEGIVRTHGIAYDGGTMILTDVGDAASDSDGAFHVITDFKTKFAAVADGAMLMVAGNQMRVAGAATMLGNPVAAEYDADNDMVYIAEAANGGGRVLGYKNANAGGDLAPTWSKELMKASSLYFYTTK